MIKLIARPKGTGKTKEFIELVKQTLITAKGDVICLEKGDKLIHDIPHKARLISASTYDFDCYAYLKGFISALHAGNYDIAHIFVDSLQKMVEKVDNDSLEPFLDWLSTFSAQTGIHFTLTMSIETEGLSEKIRQYLYVK